MKITAHGVGVNYAASGTGPPVLLLHGWGANAESFAAVQAFLTRRFSAYALDLPGFGSSDEPPDTWVLDDYAQTVEEFAGQLGLRDAVVIGHSFGGRVAIKLGARKHLAITKMVLVDSAGIRPRRPVSYYVRVYAYKAIKGALQLPLLRGPGRNWLEAYRRRAGSSDYRSASPAMRQVMVRVINEDLTSLLPSLACPVLLVWGEKDTATPLADAKVMERLIPDAGLVVFKGAGHWSYVERGREFQRVLASFLGMEDTEGSQRDG